MTSSMRAATVPVPVLVTAASATLVLEGIQFYYERGFDRLAESPGRLIPGVAAVLACILLALASRSKTWTAASVLLAAFSWLSVVYYWPAVTSALTLPAVLLLAHAALERGDIEDVARARRVSVLVLCTWCVLQAGHRLSGGLFSSAAFAGYEFAWKDGFLVLFPLVVGSERAAELTALGGLPSPESYATTTLAARAFGWSFIALPALGALLPWERVRRAAGAALLAYGVVLLAEERMVTLLPVLCAAACGPAFRWSDRRGNVAVAAAFALVLATFFLRGFDAT